MDYPLLSSVFGRVSDDIWTFLTLKEILTLSLCCKFTAGLGVSSQIIEKLVRDANKNTHLGKFRLSYSNELTTGLLRRMLNRLNTGIEANIYIDSSSGRIMMDIGSAFNDKDAFLAQDVEVVSGAGSDFESQTIFKHLENFSVDEYDDFNPRHPKPREKAHRRGDSYFNSDIDMVVNELYSGTRADAQPFNMQSIAESAANDLNEPDPPAAGTGSGAASLKSRLLAKKKAAGAGGAGGAGAPPPPPPPRPSSPMAVTRLPYQLRASAELMQHDSDEEK
mmetsp:Transcript_24460/g.40798  ORF Transcript_24460/g.40798 Transcript_24460/m.40798 type:complete len:278 (+) Transcript_24460:121-954(+)